MAMTVSEGFTQPSPNSVMMFDTLGFAKDHSERRDRLASRAEIARRIR